MVSVINFIQNSTIDVNSKSAITVNLQVRRFEYIFSQD